MEEEDLAECPVPDRELEAMKLKLWAMEQAQGPEGEKEDAGALLAGQLLSPEPDTPMEKVEANHRSNYMGNVDYGGTAQELEAYFNHCGEILQVAILCNKLSQHPKGYACIKFATNSSAQATVEPNKSVFQGAIQKKQLTRNQLHGPRGPSETPRRRGGPSPHSSLQGRARVGPRGRNLGRGRFSP